LRSLDRPDPVVDIRSIKLHSARSTLLQEHHLDDDVIPKPIEDAIPYLRLHTSPEAVEQLRNTAKAAIELFDNYVHDSRCWFRVPHFHEYAPGGYFWPRVVFEGKSNRVAWLGFDPISVALDAVNSSQPALA
jgi:hypothetical protein